MERIFEWNYAEIVDGRRKTYGQQKEVLIVPKVFLPFFTWVRFLFCPFRPIHTIYTNIKSHNGGFWKTCTKCVAALSKDPRSDIFGTRSTQAGGFKTGWGRPTVGKERNGVREEPVRLPSFSFLVLCRLVPSPTFLSLFLSLSPLSVPRNTFLSLFLFFFSPISFPAQYTERAHGRTLIVGSRHQHTWSYGKSILALHFGGNTRVRFVPLDANLPLPSFPFSLPLSRADSTLPGVRSETTRSCWDNHNEDILSMQKARRRHSAFRVAPRMRYNDAAAIKQETIIRISIFRSRSSRA